MKSLSTWAVIFAVVVTALAVWFIHATNHYSLLSDSPQVDRIVEIHNLTVIGYKGDQRAWKIKAAYTWSGYDKSAGHFEGLSDGTLYDDGKIIMARLQAQKGRGDSQHEWLEAEGGVASDVYLYQDKQVRHMLIAADKLFYNSSIRRTIVQDHVVLRYQDTVIETDEAEIDHETNTVVVNNNFVMCNNRSRVHAQSMEANLKSQIATVKNDVCLVMTPNATDGHATTLNCGYLVFSINDDEDQKLEFHDKVRFMQQNYDAFAMQGTYDQSSGRLNLQQRIELVLIDTGTVIRCQDLQALIATADQMLKQSDFSGQVDIQEHDKSIKARRASYNVGEDALRLQGDISMQVHQFRSLIRKESADRIQNAQAAEVLSKPALLECNQLYLDRKSQNAMATGDVHVVQKEQQARSEHARYIEDEDIIYLDDNVSLLKENREWIEADRVVAHLQAEDFEAVGSVDTEFILKGKQP